MSDFEVFGCNPEEFVKNLKNSITYKFSGKEMAVTSMLSDVQELIELGQTERARKMINLSKYVLVEA